MKKYSIGGTSGDTGNNSLVNSLIVEYTIPKINHHDYDTSKDWYVWHYAKHPETGKRKLFIYKKGINYFKRKKERIMEANALRLAIETALQEGWNPFTKKNTNPEVNYLQNSLKNILEVKRSSLKIKSYRTYNDIVKMFCAWLSSKHWDKITVSKFTRRDALEYADYLLKTRKFSGKSFNHNIGVMKTFFNALVSREEITINPFKGIKELPESTGSNIPYTEAERIKIIDYLKRYNIRLYYAICFVYFCFIRRSELIQLKVKDIDMINHTIRIPASVSKNRKSEAVSIPQELEKILHKMKVNDHDPEEYIIGHKFETCARRIIRADSLSTAMTRINKELGISGKGFYSFKHSGVCELYRITKDPYLVMRQCRHSELKITMIYLRSMGLTVDESIRKADFRM
jgi:integrase